MMLPTTKVQQSKISASKLGCIVIALNIGLIFFAMFKISQMYGSAKSEHHPQPAYQFTADDPSISTANYDHDLERRRLFTTESPTEPYVPPTVDRSTFASQLSNTKVKYVIVDFGEHIEYEDANDFCKEVVGKDENGNIIGSGSALASVDKTIGQSQNKQIWTMVRKCRDQVSSAANVDCWIGLKWDTNTAIWQWENGQNLEGNSKTSWGDDDADRDRLGDGASPTAAEFTSGSTQVSFDLFLF